MKMSISLRAMALLLAVLIVFPTLVSCSLFKSDAEITGITINGERIKGFDQKRYTYTYELSVGNETPPQVAAVYKSAGYINPPVVRQANTVYDVATVSSGSVTYSIIFTVKPYDESYLHNTFRRLAIDQKLNITVLGGSASCAQSGELPWQSELRMLILETFKTAEVTLSDLSIADAVTSDFASTLLSPLPDLLFIETTLGDHSAEVGADVSSANLESLIRSINQKAPRCEIIVLFSTDASLKGESYEEMVKASEMLDRLGIKYINLADAFPRGGEDLWNEYFDENGIPSLSAHELFAYCIFTFFKGEVVDKMPDPGDYRDVVLN